MFGLDDYDLVLGVAGLAFLGAAAVPRLLAERPLSVPIVYLGLGVVLFSLPIGLPDPDPLTQDAAAERLTEFAVIVSLMGVGLKLDRPVGWHRWEATWRLLAIAMPLGIAAVALLSWWAGLLPATALLVGAALAPTDPVLASDVQVERPGEGEEDEVRFTLTSEAGLNDALAFPFTNAALAAAGATSAAWVGGWFLEDVLFKIAVGLAFGILAGQAIGWLAFRLPGGGKLAETAEGFVALAATLITYGGTELAHGYGFLAVFVAAVTLRTVERGHDYHAVLHDFVEAVERLLTVVLLVLVGGAVATGSLAPLTPGLAAVGVALLVVVRPLTGWISLLGSPVDRIDRAAISFFGVRGMGSLFYVAYAARELEVPGIDRVWALVLFVVVLSVVIHGVATSPVLLRLDRRRAAARDASG